MRAAVLACPTLARVLPRRPSVGRRAASLSTAPKLLVRAAQPLLLAADLKLRQPRISNQLEESFYPSARLPAWQVSLSGVEFTAETCVPTY